MKIKDKLLLIAVLFVLVVPFMCAGNAGAAVYNTDGAVHNGTTGGLDIPDTYCVAVPSGYVSGVPTAAIKYASATYTDCKTAGTIWTQAQADALKAALQSSTDAAGTEAAQCLSLGYDWKGYSSAPWYCKPYNWTADDPNNPGSAYTDHQGCTRCHNARDGRASDRSGYLMGGHKNMNRPADGKPWGMPGVSSSYPYLGDSAEASLASNGLYTKLWPEEDFNKWTVNWGTGNWDAKVSYGRCVKGGVFTKSDLPDLKVCPDCESPLHNGNKGYPEAYPDEATCLAAAADTGLAYTWVTITDQPIYFIYGGAGLEGGPANTPVNQDYNCAACHTTGYSVDNDHTNSHAGGDTSVSKDKSPWINFPNVNFTTATVADGNKILKPSGGTGLSSWDQYGIQCSRCHAATNGGHATFPSSSTKGGDVVALCVNCHRQGGNGAQTADASVVFQNAGKAADGFDHHPDGNEFLNSPHARLTGTWGAIGCPPVAVPWGFTGYAGTTWATPGAPTNCSVGTMNTDGSTTSAYGSKFAQAAVLLGASEETAGSCVSCHDVHKTMNANSDASPTADNVVACTSCHSDATNTVTPQISIGAINHPSGVGTPLENVATEPSSACVICHQPGDIKHLWRINTDPTYTLFGDYASGVKQVNYATDANGYQAAWVDLDNACGQCHGGGSSIQDVTTTGSISAGSATLTVANAVGFAAGKEIEIAGAGMGTVPGPLKVYIASVSGTTITLTVNAVATVTDAEVTVAGNPPVSGAPYLSKATLAQYAPLMHSGSSPTLTPTGATPIQNPVTGTCDSALAATGTLGCTVVNGIETCNIAVNGSVNMTGTLASQTADAFVNWGDGSGIDDAPVSKTYTHTGRFQVVLTVRNACGFKAQKIFIVNVTGGANGKGALVIDASASSNAVSYIVTDTTTGVVITSGSLGSGVHPAMTQTIYVDANDTYSVKISYTSVTPFTDPLTYNTCTVTGATNVAKSSTLNAVTVTAGGTATVAIASCL